MRTRRVLAGHTLPEVLIYLALVGIVFSMVVPLGGDWLQRRRLQCALRHMATLNRLARLRAIVHCRHFGLWFRPTDGTFAYAMYADGNGNGLRLHDILDGTDPRVTNEELLANRFPGIMFDILDRTDIPNIPPDPGKLDPSDPIRVSPSGILSFSPLGKSNGGTVYLTGNATRMGAVRLFGPTSKQVIWEYQSRVRRWRRWN